MRAYIAWIAALISCLSMVTHVIALVATTTMTIEPTQGALTSSSPITPFMIPAATAMILTIPVPLGAYNLSMILNMDNSYVSAGECTNVVIGVQRTCIRYPEIIQKFPAYTGTGIVGAECMPSAPTPENWTSEVARTGYTTTYDMTRGSTQAVITNQANQLGTTPRKIYEGGVGYYSSTSPSVWVPHCDCYTNDMGAGGIAMAARYEIMVYNNASTTCHMNFKSSLTSGSCASPVACPTGACTLTPIPAGALNRTLAIQRLVGVMIKDVDQSAAHLPRLIQIMGNATRASYTCDCNEAQEGYDCSVPLTVLNPSDQARTDVPELVNKELSVYSQRFGQPTRFKVWLSRTNTLARVTITHGNGTGRVSSSLFNKYATRTIIRARLGPTPPPESVLTYPFTRADPVFNSGSAFESYNWNIDYSVSDYGKEYDTSTAYPTYTLVSTEQNMTLEFGADSVQHAANLSLSKNINLYVEVMIEGTQLVTGDNGPQYPFEFEVTITIDDSIGNLVGLVGICLLAAVITSAGCFLCYRARKSKDSLCTVLKGAIMSRPTVEKHVHKPKRRHRRRKKGTVDGHGHVRNDSGTGSDGLGKGVYSAKGLGSGTGLGSGGSPIQSGGPRLPFEGATAVGLRVGTPPHPSSHAVTINASAGGAVAPVGVDPAVKDGLAAPLPPPGGNPMSPSWNRQGTEQGEEEEEESCCYKTCGIATRTFVGIVGLFLALFLAILTSVFNVSLLRASLSSSIGSWVSFPNVDQLKTDIKSALSFLKVTWFSDFYQSIERYLGWLDFVESIGLSWNCGGALSVYTPIVLFFGALFLVALLQKDLLMVIGIAMKGKDDNRSWLFNQVREKGAAGLTMLILMFLQTAVVQFSSIMFSVWGIQRSCSDFDHEVVTVGRTLSIGFIIGFFYLAIMAFANVRDFSCSGLTFGWVRGIIDLVIISLGYWNARLLAVFEIKTRAKAFDTQDDGNSQQQDVMTLLAKSRSLLWVAIPSGVLLTQWCAAANSPPLLIADLRKAQLQLWFPYYKRFIMWVTSMARFVLQVGFVFYGGDHLFLASVAFAALHVFWDVILPNECGCCRGNQRRQVHPQPMPGSGMLISVSSKK